MLNLLSRQRRRLLLLTLLMTLPMLICGQALGGSTLARTAPHDLAADLPPAGMDPQDWAALQKASVPILGPNQKIESQLAPSVNEGSRLGFSVAISGDTAVVGAPLSDAPGALDVGAAYVFVRSAGTWSVQAKLTPSDGVADDYFGVSVAIDGNTAIVGALQNTGSRNGNGAAYAYTRIGSTWFSQGKLTAADGAADNQFGTAVAVSGDTALIGANLHNPTGTPGTAAAGAAYIFTRATGTWTFRAKLLPAVSQSNAGFATSVALDAGTALIGSPYIGAGAAHVFTGADASWTAGGVLVPNDGVAGDRFGWSVDIFGDRALVGSPYADVPGAFDGGAAYLFERSGGPFGFNSKLVPSISTTASSYHGYSVALQSATSAFVGGFGNSLSGSLTGAVDRYVRGVSNWSFANRMQPPDNADGDYGGWSVAADGNTMVMCVMLDDTAAGVDAGSASAWVPDLGGVYYEQGKLDAVGRNFNGQFGFSMASSGNTMVIGEPGDGSVPFNGLAYVYVRSGSTWQRQAVLAASDGSQYDRFGWSVAIDGDTILIGAPDEDPPGVTSGGAAYVFVRSGSTWSEQAKLSPPDLGDGDEFGNAVALSGERALVGAYRDRPNNVLFAGSAYIFERSGTLWNEQAKITAATPVDSEEFGTTVALGPDFAFVGVPVANTANGFRAGRVDVFARMGTSWIPQTPLTHGGMGQWGGHGLGSALGLSGDVLVVGAPWAIQGGPNFPGNAFVFRRNGAVWNQEAMLTPQVPQAQQRFGVAVAVSGEMIAVGSHRYDPSGIPNAGLGHIFTGNVGTWTERWQLAAADLANEQQLGAAIAIGGGAIVTGSPGDAPSGSVNSFDNPDVIFKHGFD